MFNFLFYQPILQSLIFIYQKIAFQNLGTAIILLTIFIRLILLPFFHRGAKDQTVIQHLQPLVKKIQQDYKNDKEKQTRELLGLYRQHHVNPFSSFLLLIIQLPILIALYRVFLGGIQDQTIFANYHFLFFDLTQKSLLLVVLAALAQCLQGWLSLPPKKEKGGGFALQTNQLMLLFVGPLLALVILRNLPSALSLYWLMSSVFSVGQQWFINKNIKRDGTNFGNNQKIA